MSARSSGVGRSTNTTWPKRPWRICSGASWRTSLAVANDEHVLLLLHPVEQGADRARRLAAVDAVPTTGGRRLPFSNSERPRMPLSVVAMLSARRMLVARRADHAAALAHDGAQVQVEQGAAEDRRRRSSCTESLPAPGQADEQEPLVRLDAEGAGRRA